jgi:DNA-binding winged helix-turn-helix (wHTH) protein/tetratricopeptide (TPR) repeat protein
MEPVVPSRPVFRFGLFEADAARGTLTRGAARIKIQHQPFHVLLVLLEHSGDIVSRETLRQKLWPEGTFVDFDGSLNVVLKKLRAAIDDDSDNPRFVETVPRRGYRFIAPVSVQNTTNAPGFVTETAPQVPESLPQRARKGSDEGRKGPLTFLAYAASSLLIIGLVGAGSLALYRNVRHRYSDSPPPGAMNSVSVRKSIAVLGFHNVSGRPEDAWLGTALSEMLRTELAGSEKLRLVAGEDVANLSLAAPWSKTDTLDAKTTARIGTALDSDLLVLGSYTVIGGSNRGQLRVDARLQEAKSGEILSEIAAIGTSKELFRIVSRVGAALRDRLGIPALAETGEASVLASVPVDPDAARSYALGLAKLRDSDASAAKDLLKQATEADPKFPLAHAMLARAYSQLGYEQKRKEEAKRAWELSRNLPPAERMLVEGDYYESIADHEKAASTYHALFELFPDNVDYGLQLASVQILAGKSNEALETVQRLRQLPPPASEDPRIDLMELRAVPKNPTALSLVHAAMSKAASQGKRLLFAQALKQECRNLAYGDHPDRANASCQDAYNIFLAAGNRLGAADALRLMGDVEATQRRYQQAIATYQRALAILQHLGEHEKTGAVLNNLAINFVNQGRLDEAEHFYRQAKTHFDAAGDKVNSSTALGNIAEVLYLRGDLPGAEKLYEETLEIRASMDSSDAPYVLYRLADLRLAEGRVQDARRLAERAIESYRSAGGSYQYLTGAMVVLAETLRAEDNLEGARSEYQQTLDIRQKTGEVELVAESQQGLAELALDEGQPHQAESLLRTAITEFEKESVDPGAATAYVSLSRALAAEGKLHEARAAVERAIELRSPSKDPALKMSLAIQDALIEIAGARQDASGRAVLAKARSELRSTVTTSKTLGYYKIECQARLALDRLEMQEKDPYAKRRLTALATEARAHGLELISRQAEQTMDSHSAALAASEASQ